MELVQALLRSRGLAMEDSGLSVLGVSLRGCKDLGFFM